MLDLDLCYFLSLDLMTSNFDLGFTQTWSNFAAFLFLAAESDETPFPLDLDFACPADPDPQTDLPIPLGLM